MAKVIRFIAQAGPEDYSGRTPTGEPKGPGKRRSKIENGESVKRGCQAHFTIRCGISRLHVCLHGQQDPARAQPPGRNALCHALRAGLAGDNPRGAAEVHSKQSSNRASQLQSWGACLCRMPAQAQDVADLPYTNL